LTLAVPVVFEELDMFAVEVVKLEKRFVRRSGGRRRAVAALDGVSLTVSRGECVAVLGQRQRERVRT